MIEMDDDMGVVRSVRALNQIIDLLFKHWICGRVCNVGECDE